MVKDQLMRLAQIVDTDPLPKNELGPETIAKIMTVIFAIIGGVTLIIIIVSGFKFILSEGNPDKVTKARNTIIYAAIGLAICVGAATIVNLVAGRL